MNINSDFNQRVVVHAGTMAWVPSPTPGVERRMLDRVGGEVARATSLVRYAPRRQFPFHVHGGGEEFFVLEGVFQDELGDFPAGSYVRNPPGSSHSPWSDQGCVILVKLWQFHQADDTAVRIDTSSCEPIAQPGCLGVRVLALHRHESEDVRLEYWEPDTLVEVPHQPGGLELFVLEGSLEESTTQLVRHSWLRVPPNHAWRARSGPTGVKLWVKAGHLADPVRLP